MKYLMKVGSEKSKMNCDASLIGADIIVPSEYFQNYQLKKSKRYRSAFTTEQIHYLEREFKKFPYIGSANRKEVANILKISERAVKIWFQNRRMKEKREVNSNKELLIVDKNNICNAFSNEQLNNRNESSHNDCSTNELLISSRYQNEHFKEPNIDETRKSNCTLNETSNVANQIKVKSMNNINISESKRNNIPIDMIKDTGNPSRFKSVSPKKERNNTKKNPAVTQRSKRTGIQQSNDTKEFKSQVKISVPLLSKKESDVAQDLSLGNKLMDQKEYRQFYPIHSSTDQRSMALYAQGYYMPPSIAATQTIHSGNVIWKPVSVMPILPGLVPTSTMTIGPNGSGISLNNQEFSKGTCNCHDPPHMFNARMQCVARTQPQYILAIPFSNKI